MQAGGSIRRLQLQLSTVTISHVQLNPRSEDRVSTQPGSYDRPAKQRAECLAQRSKRSSASACVGHRLVRARCKRGRSLSRRESARTSKLRASDRCQLGTSSSADACGSLKEQRKRAYGRAACSRRATAQEV